MLAVFAQCGHLDLSSKGGISCILCNVQYFTILCGRKTIPILHLLTRTEKQLHTSHSAAYFAQPVHSSKRSRSRVRPLNNIRSCCLPRPREGLLPLPSIHISANTHASLREIQMHHLRTGCNVMQCTHMRHASASGECRLRCWKT